MKRLILRSKVLEGPDGNAMLCRQPDKAKCGFDHVNRSGMRVCDHGFTLVEVLIALVLFSLIGVAGFTLLNAVVGVQSRTEHRLDRLAELQRAMHVMVLDFQQVAGSSVFVEDGAASFRRYSSSGVSQTIAVRYDLDEQNFRRTVSIAGRPAQEQTVLSGVEEIRWLFFDATTGWTPTWPAAGADGDLPPQAIAAELTIADERGGLAGVLRRVVRLPAPAAL